MEQKRKNLQEMRKLGFSQKTLSLMTESQIDMILEKIKKKESKEAVQTTTYKTTDPKDVESINKMPPTEKSNLTFNTDGTATKKTETTEGKKKKKKKYNPWAVCTASVGRKNKKKFEDCVMGVKKKLKEGRNPYEHLIESKMEEIVENNLSPKMTKGELLRIIAEKKMMMKKPIGKMMSMKGETMEGDTKTAPTKTPTKTEPAKRPSNPGRKTGPQENPKPKAKKEVSKSEMESKKKEIINAIFDLIQNN